jgi:excisionase family DNA binding protein
MDINTNKSASAEPLPKEKNHFSQTPAPVVQDTDDTLLEHYLTLSESQREQEFLTTEDAATFTGLSRRTLQYWVEIGDIKAIFIGRKCLISAASLRAYLKRRANEHNGGGN